jgi:predicted RNA-binding Zn-ribbon protein involved in translation (DUF1610 family)
MEALADYQKALEAPEQDRMELDTGKAAPAWDSDDLGDLSSGCCPSCGDELIGDKNTIATVCPCCGNTQIVRQRLQGLQRPEYVIPFHLEKKAAVENLKQFYNKKRLLPNFFREENRVNSMQALYVPFWLFDAKAQGSASYKATKARAWSDSNYNYTKTDHYSVIREGTLAFEKIPVDGSEKMDDACMDAIEPFDYSTMKKFQSAYLSGFIAERYDVGVDASKERAIKRIKNSVESQFANSVKGYTTVSRERSSVNVQDGKVSYALFPVWVLNTRYKNKNYQFMMNGQSGRLVGKLPVDKGKAAGYSLLFTFGIGAVFTLIIQLLRMFM